MNAPTSSDKPEAGDTHIARNRLDAHLDAAPRAWPLDIVAATGSTNADLANRLKALPRTANALPAPLVRVAFEQTAGRGRQGRPWFAQPGNALLCSVGCIVPRPVDALGGLSIAIGVALAEGLATLPLDGGTRVALKWPNDLLLTSTEGDTTRIAGKLAGILIETVWNTDDATAVVIGFGINVRGAQAVAAQVDALRARDAALASGLPPAALSAACASANLTDTLAAALNALTPALAQFASDGLAPFVPRWHALHAYAGREVVLLEQGVERARGIATGIDATGRLLLDTPDGVQAIAAGDVSLREAQ
ncbi:biotin--[acetyl-CoA-carboxylase] ligase [Burkholderia vietnamiensis]|uniref:biotin--[acetyl-CoA-carboxylase] ligase n=1 Tax=Burkholderia vietnamiensis TaxID=60552 RepID=UPI0008414081|nr:biotin--[acetyl-CoA-carboxylase] ligase [Burkholderia vietnamiensis]AOK01360.1 biotin--protein ligase [Burkholderia vietnamiensis]MBR8164041.1 biotin--[acetyl-CoA-carboxylase] ligase [Burkholderia vietnamiensis]MCA8145776.1 biotin--[acetyl-CoA-carboxylase] ligase [Burkholderia vietnamiensis]HDR8946822.1 biotin--[acetyl-CoA-carboxylase] ligase [Burkholderia vietnamiensis]HDR9207688.1 biotin--[acetyl-CoA-carboxylase] ligase [Burkholderia vietnamiensis]